MRQMAVLICILAAVTAISGCGGENLPVRETCREMDLKAETKENTREADTKAAELGLEAYQNAEKMAASDPIHQMKSIVEQFGNSGYAAVDSLNQIDMANPVQVIEFCQNVEKKNADQLTLIEIRYPDGLAVYDFQTGNGTENSNVQVKKRYYEYKDGEMRLADAGSFTAENWKYWENEYLMFSGVYFSEESYALTLSGEEEYKAFRIQPLPEVCRELNRAYILPIGYEYNNLFITDWTENAYGELNFYDLYDQFCMQMGHPYVPEGSYKSSPDCECYRIPADAFEQVIQSHFRVSKEVLHEKAEYYPEDDTYGYRPRGFQDMEYSEYPYPEVTKVSEHADGTITLTVHAVFPYRGLSKVYAHDVTIRPFADGSFQYVSNHIRASEGNYEITWHTPRGN
ncbi:MAG: DUF6070 family protein [Lachnospiraceae bacterium]